MVAPFLFIQLWQKIGIFAIMELIKTEYTTKEYAQLMGIGQSTAAMWARKNNLEKLKGVANIRKVSRLYILVMKNRYVQEQNN